MIQQQYLQNNIPERNQRTITQIPRTTPNPKWHVRRISKSFFTFHCLGNSQKKKVVFPSRNPHLSAGYDLSRLIHTCLVYILLWLYIFCVFVNVFVLVYNSATDITVCSCKRKTKVANGIERLNQNTRRALRSCRNVYISELQYVLHIVLVKHIFDFVKHK